jgi:hypothetical protein
MTAITLNAFDRFRPVNPPPQPPPDPILNKPEYDPATHYLSRVDPYTVDGVVYDYIAVPHPPVPDWVAFGAELLQIGGVKNLLSQALSSEETAPIALTLPASIIEASKGVYGTFNMIWGQAKYLNMVTESLSNEIKESAATCHIPQDFVDGL